MCYSYQFGDINIRFSEEDKEWDCLCSFPDSIELEKGISPRRLRSLALFGAAVILAYDGVLLEDFSYLPDDIPVWIQESIRKGIPDE